MKKILFAALSLCLFAACNDETTGASDSQIMSVLDAGKTLGGCSKDNAGEMVYVTDSSAVFYCAEGKWQTLNGRDGKDGSDGKDGANGKDGVNGVDGKNGTDGVDGKDGTDGKDGENGVNGENGLSGVSTKDTVVIRDTVIVNNRDTVVLNNRDTVVVNNRDTVVVINRDTVVIKEQSSGGSSGSGSSGGTSLVGKANWTYLNPAINYGEITDERDGQVYKTVKIGSQTWMAENLNFEYKIKKESTDEERSYGVSCNKDDCKVYGRYYTWAAAMDSAGVYSTSGKGCGDGVTCSPNLPVRGVCPEGWHLPDTTEWRTLYKTVGKDATVQSMGVAAWVYATNEFGFSSLPAGFKNNGFYSVGSLAIFWSAAEKNLPVATSWKVGTNSDYNYGGSGYKHEYYSIRCLKDD